MTNDIKLPDGYEIINGEPHLNPIWGTPNAEFYKIVEGGALEMDGPGYMAAHTLASWYIPPYGSVLDYGCNGGVNTYNLFKFNERKSPRVMGVDISQIDLERAVELYGNFDNLSFLHLGADEMFPQEDMFDVAFAAFVFPTHLEHEILQKSIQKLHLAIKPGGYLITTDLNPRALAFNYPNYGYDIRPEKREILQRDRYDVQFENRLLDNNGEPLSSFIDISFSTRTYIEFGIENGFDEVVSIDLSKEAAIRAQVAGKNATLQDQLAMVYWQNASRIRGLNPKLPPLHRVMLWRNGINKIRRTG